MKGSRGCLRRIEKRKRYFHRGSRVNSRLDDQTTRYTYLKKRKIFRFVEGFRFTLKYRDKGGERKKKKKRRKSNGRKYKDESTRGGHPVAHTRERSRERVSTISVAENSKRISVPRIEGYNRDRIWAGGPTFGANSFAASIALTSRRDIAGRAPIRPAHSTGDKKLNSRSWNTGFDVSLVKIDYHRVFRSSANTGSRPRGLPAPRIGQACPIRGEKRGRTRL